MVEKGGRHVPHGHMQERSIQSSTGPRRLHPGWIQWWSKAPNSEKAASAILERAECPQVELGCWGRRGWYLGSPLHDTTLAGTGCNGTSTSRCTTLYAV